MMMPICITALRLMRFRHRGGEVARDDQHRIVIFCAFGVASDGPITCTAIGKDVNVPVPQPPEGRRRMVKPPVANQAARPKWGR
jgi:hypothetical protein